MAYDEALAQRIRSALAGDAAVTEKKMFGGIAFLYRGSMFVGVSSNKALMARVGKAHYADSLSRAPVREMDFTGKPMQGYVYVDPAGLRSQAQLRFWLERCKDFAATLPPKAPK
jgi:TfoX/Sxy family transcriptional regulator of competence genes